MSAGSTIDSAAWRRTPPPGRWLAAAWWRPRLLPAALLLILLLLTVVPVLSVLAASLRPNGLPLGVGWTLRHYATIWGAAYSYRLLLDTLIFALGSTAFGIAMAGTLAWLLERTDMPGRMFFRAGILMPMATPPLLLAMGWVLLMSPKIGLLGPAARALDIYSLAGMIFVQGLAYVPTSFLILAPAIRAMDPAFEEAALIAGAPPLATMRLVSLPFLRPALLSAATLLTIVGVLTFDVPAVIGVPGNVPIMSAEIYNLMSPVAGPPRYGESAALNASLFVLLAVGLAIYYRATRMTERFATISGKGYRPTRLALGRWRGAALAAVALYFLLAVVLPFLALLWASLVPYYAGFEWRLLSGLTLKAFARLATDRVLQAALNSLVVALVAGIAVTLLSLLVAWTVIRSRLRWARLLDILSMLPISVPYLMTAVALIFIFFTIRAVPIYGTVWIIALGHLIIFLPLGSRMMQTAILQLHRELEEAASVAGAALPSLLIRVVVPLVKPAALALFIWIIVHSLREFSVAVMLTSRNNEVLSTVLYSYWDRGDSAVAAAIAVSLMLLLGILVVFLNRFSHSEAA